MKPPTVDKIMNKPVYSVDASELVAEAVKRMRENRTKKILVKDGSRPLGVLEQWMITENDRERPISEMELGRFETAPKGALLLEIKEKIMNSSAVFIYDPKEPDEFIGVLTTYDLVRAI